MKLTLAPIKRDARTNSVWVSAIEQLRSGIQTERITRRYLDRDVAVTGEAVLDSPAMLKSPVAGTVDALAIKDIGPDPVAVRKAQPILTIRPAGLQGPAQTIEVSAPANAWATVNVKPGAAVQQGGAVLFYTSLDIIPVVADIPLDLISLAKVGTAADMTCDCDPGTVWHGAVTNVLGTYSDLARAVKVKLEFPNGSWAIRSQNPVHLILHHRGLPVLAIPEDAVIWAGNRWICYVPDSESSFVARPITVGAHSPGYYELRSGLKNGDLVVSKAAFLIDAESRLRSQVTP